MESCREQQTKRIHRFQNGIYRLDNLIKLIGYLIKEGFHNAIAMRLKTMPRNLPLAPEKEEKIKAALEADPHASRVTRKLRGEASYSTVWRVADRHGIPLTAGRETMGRPRLPAEVRSKVEEAVEANPKAIQEQLARQIGGQPLDRRPSDARAAPRCPRAGMTLKVKSRSSRPSGIAYFIRRAADDCAVIGLHPDDREQVVASGLAFREAEDLCAIRIEEMRAPAPAPLHDLEALQSTRARTPRQLTLKF